MPRCPDWLGPIRTLEGIVCWVIWFVISIVVLVVLAAVVIVVLRFAIVPDIKGSIVDARLNNFAFATTQSVRTTPTFAYNISVALAVHNPNGAMSIKYTKPLVANFVFYDRRLSSITVVHEGHKYPARKREVHPFNICREVPSSVLDTAAAEEFKKQNTTGVFEVLVRLSGELTLGIGNKHQVDLSCLLRMQLAPPGPEVVVFHEVDCQSYKPDKIYF